jgi:hypothetical protein
LTWASAVVLLGSGEVSLAHSWLSLGRIAKRTVGKARDAVQAFLLNMQMRRYEAKRKAKAR